MAILRRRTCRPSMTTDRGRLLGCQKEIADALERSERGDNQRWTGHPKKSLSSGRFATVKAARPGNPYANGHRK
jgi:hypothetical protein